MPPTDLLPLAEIHERLEKVLAASPADVTELAWLEVRRGRETNGKRRRDVYERSERTILVRVREFDRTGCHRTGAATVSELEGAVRQALAQARTAVPSPPVARADGLEPATPSAGADLFDDELALLTPGRARDLLQRLAGRSETVRLAWAEGRIAVANSHGLRRSRAVTAAALQVVSGQGPGSGEARAAARTLAALAPERVLERARRRQAGERAEGLEELPEAAPLLLSQEAVAPLVAALNRLALSAAAFRDGTSYLCDKLGIQVFNRAISLLDDGTDPRGLPFPFDLEGASKRPVDLVLDGVAVTPAVDELLARELERPPTPHSLGHGEALATNLFLKPGEATTEDLARAAAGGVWAGIVEGVELFDPRTLRFRATVRGARRLDAGARAQVFPDLVWEDSLPNVLSRVLGVGAELVTTAGEDGLLGGISTPMLAIERAESLRPAR